ncbi:hypothetical protein OHU34_04450 [Streptomyces sp. NBC_00080]|uniref:hypothetical protein n=1 Tax=Streptomyces TaxID=1883 RepID=UPI001F21489E|nr:hypothetical protein [Streptomyces sp. SLBN-115]
MTVGTSLTPEFWERFALLFVLATGVTFVLAATFDALAVRLLRSRTQRTPPHRTHLEQPSDHRMSTHC